MANPESLICIDLYEILRFQSRFLCSFDSFFIITFVQTEIGHSPECRANADRSGRASDGILCFSFFGVVLGLMRKTMASGRSRAPRGQPKCPANISHPARPKSDPKNSSRSDFLSSLAVASVNSKFLCF